MYVYVLYDPGDTHVRDEEIVKAYQTEEKLYKDILHEILNFNCEDDYCDQARLLFDKGDFEDLIDLYEEITDVRMSVFKVKLIK